MSLRQYLLSTLLGLMAVLLLVSAVAGYLESRHELEEVFDAELAQHAKVLRVSLAPVIERHGHVMAVESWHGDEETTDAQQVDDASERDATGHAYENKIAFQLWSSAGVLLGRSNSAPTQPFSSFVAGYSDQLHGEHEWRIFTLQTSDGGWIQVGHRDDVRGELSAEIAAQTIVPGLLLIPIMALAIVLVLRFALRPLQQLVNTLNERTPTQLDPLKEQLAPVEVQPLVRSFNALMQRLSDVFQQQKRFIADAAHELKTPLAALQIHTENALAVEGEERQQALLHIKEGIARTNRLIEQLLLLSRLEHQRNPVNQTLPQGSPCDLTAITRQLFDELNVLARRKQQRLQLNGAEQAVVVASEMPLRAMLRNLIDNALRYSPSESSVIVTISRDDTGLCWRICDHGPGITAEAKERVFEPFFRVLGNEASGTGLGLAIAREAADQLGAHIQLMDNSPTGLCVSVRWPHSG